MTEINWYNIDTSIRRYLADYNPEHLMTHRVYLRRDLSSFGTGGWIAAHQLTVI